MNADAALRLFTPDGMKKGVWPSWIVVEWEDAYLFRSWLNELWDTIEKLDRAAERVISHPQDAAGAQSLLEDIGSSSLFSARRLIIAHLQRPFKRFLPADHLARRLLSMPENTIVVLAVEGMGWFREEKENLKQKLKTGSAPRGGFDIAIFKPFPERLELYARDILLKAGLHADRETLKFWLHRIGSDLDRLESEAKRLKHLTKDGEVSEVTQEMLEDVFENPHVHDKTMWNALEELLRNRSMSGAAGELERYVHSLDPQAAFIRLTHALMCIQALAAPDASPSEVFRRFEVNGKRRQQVLSDIAAVLTGSIPDLADRLLKLDLALKKAKSAAGRQEILLRGLLTLGGEPETAA